MPQEPLVSYSDPILNRWALFMRTRNLLYKLFTRDIAELGIKPEQLGILNILQNTVEPVTPSLISRVYHREPHTVSVNLRRLEAKGLITLTKDLDRHNMIRVEITQTGQSIWQQGIKKTENVGLVFSELTQAETDQLDSIIKKLADATQNLSKRI